MKNVKEHCDEMEPWSTKCAVDLISEQFGWILDFKWICLLVNDN